MKRAAACTMKCRARITFMTRNLVCSECGGSMQSGFVVETKPGANRPLGVAYWLEGKPEIGILGVNIEGKQAFFMTVYRCEQCGLLKLYANPDLSSKN